MKKLEHFVLFFDDRLKDWKIDVTQYIYLPTNLLYTISFIYHRHKSRWHKASYSRCTLCDINPPSHILGVFNLLGNGCISDSR